MVASSKVITDSVSVLVCTDRVRHSKRLEQPRLHVGVRLLPFWCSSRQHRSGDRRNDLAGAAIENALIVISPVVERHRRPRGRQDAGVIIEVGGEARQARYRHNAAVLQVPDGSSRHRSRARSRTKRSQADPGDVRDLALEVVDRAAKSAFFETIGVEGSASIRAGGVTSRADDPWIVGPFAQGRDQAPALDQVERISDLRPRAFIVRAES